MITTFDNKQWDKQELLDNMYDDSFYYGYLGKNALSSSSAKMLISSPKTYKYVTQYGSDESQALRDGKLFHTMILEPHKLNDLVIVDVATKAGKEYKLAKEQGLEVYTRKEYNDAERLTDALMKNNEVVSLMSKSQTEIPAIERDLKLKPTTQPPGKPLLIAKEQQALAALDSYLDRIKSSLEQSQDTDYWDQFKGLSWKQFNEKVGMPINTKTGMRTKIYQYEDDLIEDYLKTWR